MEKIKLLLVDDSLVFREIVAKHIQSDGTIEVVEKAADLNAAKDAIEKYNPDVMALDIDNPRPDSAAALRKLLAQRYIPTIVVTTAAARRMEFVTAGAVDFLVKKQTSTNKEVGEFAKLLARSVQKAYKSAKPRVVINSRTADSQDGAPFKVKSHVEQPARFDSSLQSTAELAAKAQKTVSDYTGQVAKSSINTNLPQAPKNSYMSAQTPKLRRSDTIIALGASTGGTEALEQVIRQFPADTPPVVIVQHMPAGFTKLYAERLNRSCRMDVKEAEDKDRLRTGLIIIGAGDFQLRVCKDARGYYVSSKREERVSGHCPSVDVLFRSMAETVGANAIGAIFTGMGRDGADGLLQMRQAGAFTIGQDKETSVVYGMPMEAYRIGAVQVQAPLDKIAGIILGALI